MMNMTPTARGNAFWFENADGDAYDEPSVRDVVYSGGRVRVVMKTSVYRPGKAVKAEPPKSPIKAPAKAPSTKPKAKAEKPIDKPGKSTGRTGKAASGMSIARSPLTPAPDITGELYVFDARDKCRVSWSHTNRELLVPWTDTAEGVLRIFAFMMGYKVGRGKGAVLCETRGGVSLAEPTMRQIMDAGRMVKVSMRQVKE